MSDLSVLMSSLMQSLLEILRGHYEPAAEIMNSAGIEREPEVVVYFARHYSMLGDESKSLQMIRRAREEGFFSSFTLKQDWTLAACRRHPDFHAELHAAIGLEEECRAALSKARLIL